MVRKKIREGNQTIDLLLDLIFSLSPLQLDNLYKELLPRYTKRGRVTLYDSEGKENPEGKIRLMPCQYRTIRTRYGDSYIVRAFSELTNYITFLEEHLEDRPDYKQKLKRLKTGTHNALIGHPDGWVYQKHKAYICSDRLPQLNVNPYLIDDISTAREYLRMIPRDTWNNSMDVSNLLLRFPTLATEEL